MLQRGPQRSTRDAIASLGNIPILQPQSQQAILSSDAEDHDTTTRSSPARHHHSGVLTEIISDHTVPTTVPSSTPPVLPTMQLPLRPRPDQHASPRYSVHDQTTHNSVTTSMTAASILPEGVNANDTNRPTTPFDNPAELRGGGRPGKQRERVVSQDMANAQSPLQQVQRFSSPRQAEPPRDPVKSLPIQNDDEPMLYLQGYFKPLSEEPAGVAYHFRESTKPIPQSEPRRRSGRRLIHDRSLSSGSMPAYPWSLPRPDTSSSSNQDALRPVYGPGPPSGTRHGSSRAFMRSSSGTYYTFQTDQLTPRPRHFSSEASNTSVGFSYYGSLPSESRHSSSSELGQDLSSHQHDGAVASQPGISTTHAGSPTSSGYHLSHTSIAGQHGISPLPSMPYTRVPTAQTTAPLMPQDPDLTGVVIDASTAAARDLRSPLDDYSVYYQRMLQAQHTYRPAQSGNHAWSHPFGGGGTSPFQTSQTIGGHPYGMMPAHASMPSTISPTQNVGHQPVETSGDRMQHGRPSQGYRSNRRSSENAPVHAKAQDNRQSQVQVQRAAYEQLQNAVQAMQEIGPSITGNQPPTTRPRDVSNQSHGQPPHATRTIPRTHHNAPSSSPPPFPTHRQPTGPRALPALPPPHNPRHHSAQAHPRTHNRLFRPVPSTTAPPLTSLALDHGSGTSSRTLPRTRTHRRVPAHQRDQENSLEGERDAMRREEGTMRARAGEDGRLDVMDETPPRVGRVERRILE